MINSQAHSLLLIEKIDEQFIDVERWALSSLNTVVRPCLMEHLGDRLTPPPARPRDGLPRASTGGHNAVAAVIVILQTTTVSGICCSGKAVTRGVSALGTMGSRGLAFALALALAWVLERSAQSARLSPHKLKPVSSQRPLRVTRSS